MAKRATSIVAAAVLACAGATLANPDTTCRAAQTSAIPPEPR